MRSFVTRAALVAAALACAGCDPLYTLGVRTTVAPTPDAGCLGAALRRLPRATVRQPDPRVKADFLVTLGDSTAPGGSRDARVRLTSRRDATSQISLSYSWLGTARQVPLEDQRRMVALGSSVVTAVQAACDPGATAPVQCFTVGFGGSPACKPAA